MKYYVEVIGDQSVGIDPEYHEVELIFHDSRYEYNIEFYNEIEKAFIQMLKEFYENGTLVNVETEYEKELREEAEEEQRYFEGD